MDLTFHRNRVKPHHDLNTAEFWWSSTEGPPPFMHAYEWSTTNTYPRWHTHTHMYLLLVCPLCTQLWILLDSHACTVTVYLSRTGWWPCMPSCKCLFDFFVGLLMLLSSWCLFRCSDLTLDRTDYSATVVATALLIACYVDYDPTTAIDQVVNYMRDKLNLIPKLRMLWQNRRAFPSEAEVLKWCDLAEYHLNPMGVK